ncbi:MAG: hypothetical protein ABI921_13710 [Panacibacter sp.]
MKNVAITALFIIFFNSSYAQWMSSLTLKPTETFAGISSPSDKVIWAITYSFTIYTSTDGGGTWKSIEARGFSGDLRVVNLYAINGNTALLSVNTNFTGVGPGIVYRTNDGGKNWAPVFSHKGNCTIRFGMFNGEVGLISCSYDSFNGSVETGQDLYYTKDGGNTWKYNKNNPNKSVFVNDFGVNEDQVVMTDYNFFYYSANRGLNWSKQKTPAQASNNVVQFVDSSYVVSNSGALIDIFVKRPGSNGWVNIHDPTGISGALTGLVLDGSECWFGMGFDTFNNYYSSDSAKTFTPFIADPNSGFLMMTKARKGSTIMGTTFGGGAKLWINKRIPVTVQPTKKPVYIDIKNIHAETE